jgi:hypothetical protein
MLLCPINLAAVIIFVVIPSPVFKFSISNYGKIIVHTNEQNNILGLLLLLKRPDDPIGNCLRSVIVAQSSHILSLLVQGNATVGLGGNPYNRRGLGIFCKQVLIPGEVPSLESWLSNLEERCSSLRSPAFFSNRENEIWIRYSSVCF